MWSATIRAMVSIGPPGGNGTISLIGLFGYGCAAAWVAMPTPNAMAAASSTRLLIIVCSP